MLPYKLYKWAHKEESHKTGLYWIHSFRVCIRKENKRRGQRDRESECVRQIQRERENLFMHQINSRSTKVSSVCNFHCSLCVCVLAYDAMIGCNLYAVLFFMPFFYLCVSAHLWFYFRYFYVTYSFLQHVCVGMSKCSWCPNPRPDLNVCIFLSMCLCAQCSAGVCVLPVACSSNLWQASGLIVHTV